MKKTNYVEGIVIHYGRAEGGSPDFHGYRPHTGILFPTHDNLLVSQKDDYWIVKFMPADEHFDKVSKFKKKDQRIPEITKEFSLVAVERKLVDRIFRLAKVLEKAKQQFQDAAYGRYASSPTEGCWTVYLGKISTR